MRRISERPEEEEESTTDSTSRAVSLEENIAAGDKKDAVAGDTNDSVGDKGDCIIEGVESSSESISKLGSTPISVPTNPPIIASTATAKFGRMLEECRHLSEPPDGDDVTLSSNAISSEHSTNKVSSNMGSPPTPSHQMYSSTRASGRVLEKTARNVSELSLGVDGMDSDDHPDLDEKSNGESRADDEKFRAMDDNPQDTNKDLSYKVPTFSTTHTSESDNKKEALDVSDLSLGVDDMYLEMDELFDSERNLNDKSESTSQLKSDELQMSSERERAENWNHSEFSKESGEGDRGNLDPFNGSSSSESYETDIEDDRLDLRSSRLHIHPTRDSMVSALSLSGASALMPPKKQT